MEETKTIVTTDLHSERQCSIALNLDETTLHDYRVAGLITPIAEAATVRLYNLPALADVLIERALSRKVRAKAEAWKAQAGKQTARKRGQKK